MKDNETIFNEVFLKMLHDATSEINDFLIDMQKKYGSQVLNHAVVYTIAFGIWNKYKSNQKHPVERYVRGFIKELCESLNIIGDASLSLNIIEDVSLH